MTSTQPQATQIIDILPETSDTQTFRLGTYFPYKAGQAICLLIPGDPKKRYYSLSSSPTEKDYLSITIKADRDNPALYGSLFSLKKGSPVEIMGPMGSFNLPDTPHAPYYFIAAGSGVAPFRGMVKYLKDLQPATETWLIHSVKTPDDLIFKEEFLEWSKNPLFHYVPTFTRWQDTTGSGETGRIGETLLQKHLNMTKGTFFICGSTPFVNDMEHVLTNLQVLPERIRREQW